MAVTVDAVDVDCKRFATAAPVSQQANNADFPYVCYNVAHRHASSRYAIGYARKPEYVVNAFNRNFFSRLLHVPCRALIIAVLAVYVFSSSIHGVFGFELANSSAAVTASLADDGGHVDDKAPSDHHCHGCFVFSLTSPALVPSVGKIVARIVSSHEVLRVGQTRGIDPPPPKSLT